MSLFRKKESNSYMDIIRCDEQNYLIWKWQPKGISPSEGKRANAVRWGSSLRVKSGEVAVFVYPQENGSHQDYIYGPFDRILKTDNLPILSDIIGLAYGGNSPFQAEIYFINLAHMIQVKFGIPFFDVFDPRFTDFSVPVAVRGTINFRIEDVERFVQLHKLVNFTLEDFQNQIKSSIGRYVKDIVGAAPAVHNISVVQLESTIAQINDEIEYILANRLEEDFGVIVSGIDINAIEIDKTSDDYRQLVSVTKDLTANEIKARAALNIKDIKDKQQIEIENTAETMRIKREENQYAQRLQTRSTNISAFQIEKQAELGMAGAESLGKMGINGGAVDSGINITGMMTSMIMGNAVAQNIASTINNTMSNINKPTSVDTVPSVPKTYYVAIDGQAEGPFDMDYLKQMATKGSLTENSLVWNVGMTEWTTVTKVDELKTLFTIPPIPQGK